MSTRLRYYEEELLREKEVLKKLEQQLNLTTLGRLISFALLAGGVLFWWFRDEKGALYLGIPGLFLFVFFILRQLRLKSEKQYRAKLQLLLEQEIQSLLGIYQQFRDGSEFHDPSHPFSADLDLFGPFSFFQYLNRSTTPEGYRILAQMLTSNDCIEIPSKQEAIRELSLKDAWQRAFRARALTVENQQLPFKVTKSVDALSADPVGHRIWITGFQVISIILLVTSSLGWVSGKVTGLWFVLGLILSATYFKRANALSAVGSSCQELLRQYHPLLKLMEEEHFQSAQLSALINKLKNTSGISASSQLQKLSRAFDALDQRNNMIVGILGNGFFLMDRHNGQRISSWIRLHRTELHDWLEAVSKMDAWVSLGNYAFNHPDHQYPVIPGKSDSVQFQVKALSHPLIPIAKRVNNDFSMENHTFSVITGANMAGKSTFLRSIGLFVVMANTGLPTCCESATYQPIPLLSSMRTSDDLHREASYFFAELERLQMIVRKLEKRTYFVILDEILKGTNSLDKAEGSRKFVKKIADLGACGLIATHDLSLCTLEKEDPRILNYFFEAYIREDQLSFDYKIKRGICQNMNASFLMKKMGIV